MRRDRRYTFNFGCGDLRRVILAGGNTRTAAERRARRELRSQLRADESLKGLPAQLTDPSVWLTLESEFTPDAKFPWERS